MAPNTGTRDEFEFIKTNKSGGRSAKIVQKLIGTLIPSVNAVGGTESKVTKRVLTHNLQYSMVVNQDQDIWIQPEVNQYQGHVYTLTSLFEVNPLPENRTNLGGSRLQYRHRKLEYVQPMNSPDTKNTIYLYKGTGLGYRVKAGTYLLVQGFIVPSQRDYTITITGSGLSFKLLT